MKTEPVDTWKQIALELETVRNTNPCDRLLGWGTLSYPGLLMPILIWPNDWVHGDDEQLDDAVIAHLEELENQTKPRATDGEELCKNSQTKSS